MASEIIARGAPEDVAPVEVVGGAGDLPGQPSGDVNESAHMADSAANVTADRHATPHRPVVAQRATAGRSGAHVPPAGRKAAGLMASGMPLDRAARECGVNPSTVWRWRTESTWWAGVYRRAQATVGAETEAELAAARLEAVRALRGVVAPADGQPTSVDPAELSSAARALLAASSPPGEMQRHRARLDLLRALTPETRARVVAELDGDARYAGMSDAELAALAGEGDRG